MVVCVNFERRREEEMEEDETVVHTQANGSDMALPSAQLPCPRVCNHEADADMDPSNGVVRGSYCCCCCCCCCCLVAVYLDLSG